MRPILIAAALSTIMASPLPAQASKDTADIRRAAVADTGERVARLRIVADTAWAQVVDRRNLIDIPGGTSADGKALTMGTAIKVREVRLERRGGKWVVVSLRSMTN